MAARESLNHRIKEEQEYKFRIWKMQNHKR